MSESSTDAPCPDGHANTRRLLSIAGMTGTATATATAPRPSAGGCCGGACCGG